MATVFRLVMCPKCRQVLPELPNVPLYRCGGCGTLLQAKNRKVEAKRREPEQQKTNIKVRNKSSHEAKASPENVKDHQDGYGDCNGEEPGAEDCDMEGPRVEADVYSSDEKTKLLRAIHELQDKLDRIGDIPTCYNHHCCHCHHQEVKISVPLPHVLCHGSARADKCCSEVEVKKQQKSRSPLHRLMGYSSPSLIIRGT